MSKMIAKVDLREFSEKIKSFRNINNFKAETSMTKDDEKYYRTIGLGFEQAISIFLDCATYMFDDEKEAKQ